MESNQGKHYTGFGTFVLPVADRVPEYLDGHEVPFVQRSFHSKFQQDRRDSVYGKAGRFAVDVCGGLLDERSVHTGAIKSHQYGWKGTLNGPHSYVGLCKEVLKDVSVNLEKETDKQVSHEVFNGTSTRWKYGKQETNDGVVKGIRGVNQMSKEIILHRPRGANEAGRYAGTYSREYR